MTINIKTIILLPPPFPPPPRHHHHHPRVHCLITTYHLLHCHKITYHRHDPSVLIIIVIGHHRNRAFEMSKCEISDNFTSPYISATYRSLVPALGCEANATSTKGQQVHILRVVPPAGAARKGQGRSGRLTVTLSVFSRTGRNLTGLFSSEKFVEDGGRPVIFVLSSPVPVTWKVGLHGVADTGQEKHVFMGQQASEPNPKMGIYRPTYRASPLMSALVGVEAVSGKKNIYYGDDGGGDDDDDNDAKENNVDRMMMMMMVVVVMVIVKVSTLRRMLMTKSKI
ncbi:hypothetical protein PoB_007205800 [Plakobranchus ocellatus]|uniref:Uncharacterized protein n=1 Tax=Plakobranchus ocellatus TaxID=259542 RepID=A0AAV4DMK6_9GAST|nr:hypothetical protein PoB_007205800 [Plakobranchus ocellatus]